MAVKFSDFASSGLNSTGFIVGYDSGTNQNIRIPKSTLDSTYQPTLISGTNIKTINGSSVLGSGNISTASVNPTSTYIPYNNGGVFANSSLRVYPDTIFGTGIPFGIYNVKNPVFGGGFSLNIDDYNAIYSLGDASASPFSVSAFYGVSIAASVNSAIIGCGISSPSNGAFYASGPDAIVRIGTNSDVCIGVDTMTPSMRIGSYLITTGTHTSISKWVTVTDGLGNTYYLPLYT